MFSETVHSIIMGIGSEWFVWRENNAMMLRCDSISLHPQWNVMSS